MYLESDCYMRHANFVESENARDRKSERRFLPFGLQLGCFFDEVSISMVHGPLLWRPEIMRIVIWSI